MEKHTVIRYTKMMNKGSDFMRKAGILMPVASMPSRHGCGTFGRESFEFIDLLKKAEIGIWQILPLNPLGYGNSPYQPYSSYAMDDIYISLDLLAEQGLIEKAPSYRRRADRIDYEAVRRFREPYLKEAYRNFVPDLNYTNFSYQEWVKHYSVFMAFKKKNGMKCWLDWPEEEKNYLINGDLDLKEYQDEILYEVFLQYILYLQWKDLKQYANDNDIEIMGDVPFYVGIDSADVWSDRSNFLLDDDGRPIFIAGVPPDYFSATGQRWGNPIYDWEYMEKDKFGFWMNRLAYTARLFDIIRVDHFRAFDTYWKIKASCPTAIDGEWIEAPGYALFDTLFEKMPDIEIVAEDLGDLRNEVLVLRDHYKFRGMRVVQFSFDPNGMPADKEHLLIYTGTHDNEPILSWYLAKPEKEKRAMRRYLHNNGYRKHSFSADIIDYALASNADMAVVPLSDFMHMSKEARLNKPGTVGAPNWMWRISDFSRMKKYLEDIRTAVVNSGRGH